MILPASRSRALPVRLDADPSGSRDDAPTLDVRHAVVLERAEHALAGADDDGLAPLLDLRPSSAWRRGCRRPFRPRGGLAARGGPWPAGSSRGCSPSSGTCRRRIPSRSTPWRPHAAHSVWPPEIPRVPHRSRRHQNVPPYRKFPILPLVFHATWRAHARSPRSIHRSAGDFHRFSLGGAPPSSRLLLFGRQKLKFPDRRAVGGFEDVQPDDLSGDRLEGLRVLLADACAREERLPGFAVFVLEFEFPDAVVGLADRCLGRTSWACRGPPPATPA